MNYSKAFIAVSVALLSGCATTNQNKRLLLTGAGMLTGAAVGLSRPENQAKNAVLYSGLIGLGAAVASEFLFDDEKERVRLIKETEKLKAENDLLRKDPVPTLKSEGQNLLEAPIPRDVRKLVSPGSWKRFKLDRWVQDEGNENLWYRQTEMFEVVPPSVSGH